MHIPSNFEGRARNGTQLGANGEDSIELSVYIRNNDFCRNVHEHSRFAYAHVCLAVVVAEREINGAELVELTAIDTDVLREGRENEIAFVGGGQRFGRHFRS